MKKLVILLSIILLSIIMVFAGCESNRVDITENNNEVVRDGSDIIQQIAEEIKEAFEK